MRTFIATVLLICAAPAAAQDNHDTHGGTTDGIFIALVTISVLGALLAIYNRRPIPFPKSVVYAAASIAALAAAWVRMAHDIPFASHMLAQMVLMDVAAPLAVVALASTRRFTRIAPSFISARNISGRFLVAGTFHAVVMWAWHVPAIYTAAGAAPLLHAGMQVSFLVAGVAFWHAVAGARGVKPGLALFWLFMMVMHTGLLGALLTFAPAPLYGVTLEDQRLGGLMMWVIGTSIYALAGLLIAARWLALLERDGQRARPA